MFNIFFINFLLAISTTVGMTIIPFLITDSLGLSIFILGLIEGLSEFLSNAFRLTNGVLFDKVKNKRLIFISSTGLALTSKICLLFPSSIGVLCAKILERIANGTFASPRDAFVASKANNKGMALGLLNVSKSLGCVLGPLLVSISTLVFGNLKDNFEIIIFFCCSLSVLAFLFSFSLQVNKIKEENPFVLKEINSIFKRISPILLIAFLFFLGRFNDGLIMIHLKKQNFPEWFYLSTIAIFNSIMLISSPFIGREIDKGKLRKLIYITVLALGIFNVFFYRITGIHWMFAILGLFCWGIQRASAQIVFASCVFNYVPKENYGTAIGIYYLVTGLASMVSAICCGYIANGSLSYFSNPANVFIFSGFFALLALMAALYLFSRELAEPAELAPAQSELIEA